MTSHETDPNAEQQRISDHASETASRLIELLRPVEAAYTYGPEAEQAKIKFAVEALSRAVKNIDEARAFEYGVD